MFKALPLPDFFDPLTVGHVWRVPYEERARQAREWASRFAIPPAENDERRVGLMLIDVQNTFCVPGFELFVSGRSGVGAVEDNRRLCSFTYRNLPAICEIVVTLDTHCAMQIFHGAFLEDSSGAPAPAWSSISAHDVAAGRWRLSAAAKRIAEQHGVDGDTHLAHYCRELARRGKYELTIWPYHAMLGGIGHALVSAVEEACFFHAIARQSPTRIEMKGEHPLTENYSALSAEVETAPDGSVLAGRNDRLIERLLSYDMLIVAGQAQSHCVAWTVADLLAAIVERDASLASRIYLLEDCTSPVVAPGADFTDQATAAFARFAASGMHVVRSTTPMDQWPSHRPVLQ